MFLTVISGFASCLGPNKPADTDDNNTKESTVDSSGSESKKIPDGSPLDGIVYEFRNIEDYGAFVTNNRDFDLIYGAPDGFSSGFFADKDQSVLTECLEKYSKSPEYQGNDRLPVMYNLIRDIGMSREEFVRSNEKMKTLKLSDMSLGIYVYTDQEIEYLFGDYDKETVMRHLKAPTAFYSDGRLYTIYDLDGLDDLEQKSVAETGNIDEYLIFMKKFVAASKDYYAAKHADSYYLPQVMSGYDRTIDIIDSLCTRCGV